MKNGNIKKINQHRKVFNFGTFFLLLYLYPGYEMLTLDIILSKKKIWYRRVCTIVWLGKVVDGYAIVGCGVDVGLGYLGLLIQFG